MKDFRCAQCRLTNINLSPFTKLRSLDLSYSPFTDTGLEGLAGLKELRRLILRDTMVTDEGLKHLGGLTNLEELDLSGTRITDKGIESLRKMTAMRKLNLLGAQATDASMDVLAGMKHLQVVNLYRTRITNSGVARLQELKELTDVDLRYSRVTVQRSRSAAGGAAEFQSAIRRLLDDAAENRGSGPAGGQYRQAIAAWVKAMGGTADFAGGRLQGDRPILHLRQRRAAVVSVGAGRPGKTGSGSHAGRRPRRVAALEHLTGLKELNLSQTTVSDAGLAKLAGLTQLQVLKLAGTLVEGRGLAHSRPPWPDCANWISPARGG